MINHRMIYTMVLNNMEQTQAFTITSSDNAKLDYVETVDDVVDTDEKCVKVLNEFAERNSSQLDAEALALLQKCCNACNASVDDDVDFGPADFVQLGFLAVKFPADNMMMMACMHHILHSLDFEGDELPPDFNRYAALAHKALGDAYNNSDDAEVEDYEEHVAQLRANGYSGSLLE